MATKLELGNEMNTTFETERQQSSNPRWRTVLCAILSVGLAVFGFHPSQAKAETYVGELVFYAGNNGGCKSSTVLADGSRAAISSNAALYEALGRPHSDDGATFLVPNALVPFPPSEVEKPHIEPPKNDVANDDWDRILEALIAGDTEEATKIAEANSDLKKNMAIKAAYLKKVKAEEAMRASARKLPCVSLVGKDPMSGDNGQPLQGRVAGELMLIATSQCPQGWQQEASLNAVDRQLLWCKATSGSGVASTMTQIMLFSGGSCPQTTLEADGQLLRISESHALFALLGTLYGGSGRSDFGWPSRAQIELELLSFYPPAGARFCIVKSGEYPRFY